MKTKADLSVMNKLLLLFLPNVTLIEVPFYKNGCKLIKKDKNGSGIHIKKKNRGKFTKSAKLAGNKPSLLYGSDGLSNIKIHGLDSYNQETWKFDQPLTFEVVPIGKGDSRYLFSNNFEVNRAFEEAIASGKLKLPNLPTIEAYLLKNYLSRQILENLRYAAENGLTKMRYPTPETAAKIEGYSKLQVLNDAGINRRKEIETLERMHHQRFPYDYSSDKWHDIQNMRTEMENNQSKYYNSAYSSEHQTILKKYADFPKQYLKLFGKNAEVRTITDAKGNTWYEVDVPLNYLDGAAEIQFALGGKLNTYDYGDIPNKLIPKRIKLKNVNNKEEVNLARKGVKLISR